MVISVFGLTTDYRPFNYADNGVHETEYHEIEIKSSRPTKDICATRWKLHGCKLSLLFGTLLFWMIETPVAAFELKIGWVGVSDIRSAQIAHDGAVLISSSHATNEDGNIEVITFWKYKDTMFRCVDEISEFHTEIRSSCFMPGVTTK